MFGSSYSFKKKRGVIPNFSLVEQGYEFTTRILAKGIRRAVCLVNSVTTPE